VNILDRLTIASVAFIAAAVSIIAFSPSKSDKQPVVTRTGNQLCAEVKHELDIHVKRGMMTQGRADAIVKRCFKLYGGTTL
jgi:hypothetical protein